ncbi:MAG: GTP-binding protein [Promethearchaeota archaeon]
MPKRTGEKPKIPDILGYNSVLIGLLGHVDSGKTAIARMISEIISTAGLDAHPQSKERGITIDLGFTSLILGKNLVTLVDVPGHADLIRSVVASANIIEGGILVIDGKEGMQVQTAEHLVILESLNIKNIIVAINKIDLISETQAERLEKQVRRFLRGSVFGDQVPIIRVSAKKNNGASRLKKALEQLIEVILKKRNLQDSEDSVNSIETIENDLIYPIDHHFKLKGIGLIVTGTILSGIIKTGDLLTILPQNLKTKVKSLQVFYQDLTSVPKGFRVGASLSFPGKTIEGLSRGNIITNNPDLFTKGEITEIKLNINNYFKSSIYFGSQINATLGLLTVNARIFPFRISGNKKILIKSLKKSFFTEVIEENGKIGAFLWFLKPVYLKKGEKILLSRLDLPPTTLRFFGTGTIESIIQSRIIPTVFYFKKKIGRVRNSKYGPNTFLIEGLARSKQGAETLIGNKLEPPLGKIVSTFGKKGVVVATIRKITKDKKNKKIIIKDGDEVVLTLIRELELQKDKSY